jgi:4-aminobutyrate aminotransferase
LGLLLGIELVQDQQALRPANAAAERVMYECLRRGLNFKVTMGNILTLTPALTVSEGELRLAFSILQESIAKTAAEGG